MATAEVQRAMAVDGPGLAMRPYQIEAVEAVEAAYERGITRPLVVSATGSGKTVAFSHLIDRRGGRSLVLAHRIELIDQAAHKLRQVMPGASIGVVKAERNETRAEIVVASIQTLARKSRRERLAASGMFDTIIVDEAHHASAETYVNILRHFNGFEDDGPLVAGFTATPDPKNRRLNAVWQEVVFEWGILTGIDQGYLCDLSALRVSLNVDLAKVKTVSGDFADGELGQALEAGGAPALAVQSYLAHAPGRKALCFTPTVHMAHVVAETFRSAGVVAEAVDGETPREHRRAMFARFRSGETRVLANCGIATEGYDEPSVDCVIIARPTKSRTLYCFDAATELLTRDGWRHGCDVRDGEIVAAFDPETGAVRWEPVVATVERALLPGERMVKLVSPSIDIRVTDQHRMIWRRRAGRARARTAWGIGTAGELLGRKNEWELPVAGDEPAVGLAITDAEIAFLGWVQTDGCVNHLNGAISISQQRPEQRAHIEETLTACGFKWRVSIHDGETNFGARRHPLAVYRVSRGHPRGEDTHLRGWDALADFIPKVDASAWWRLEAMDARQWAVFLDAWHRGDGSKQEGQGWTRRSYHLAIADSEIAGWVQAMCMRRGWRANTARQANLWIVHCREGAARYVGGSSAKDRPTLVESQVVDGERVWCVTVPSGAVLTRRNGKGAIMGNCQMVGRGTRMYPGKSDCLILDMVGAAGRHSLIQLGDAIGLPGDLSAGVKKRRASDQRAARLGIEAAALVGTVDAQEVSITARFTWVQARNGFALSLGSDGFVAIKPDHDGTWAVGHLRSPRDRQRISSGLDFGYAQGVAEDYARSFGVDKLIDRGAGWRERAPSEKQARFARSMGVDARGITAGELSQRIDAVKLERIMA